LGSWGGEGLTGAAGHRRGNGGKVQLRRPGTLIGGDGVLQFKGATGSEEGPMEEDDDSQGWELTVKGKNGARQL
jgi:hypothetical protein